MKYKFAFFGSVNAMPMAVALDLRKLGHEVAYFVDSDLSETLHRPENHYTEIGYPYPDWIRELEKPFVFSELSWYGKLRQVFAPRIFYRRLINDANQFDVCILNSYGMDLAPFISHKTTKVFLSSGSDLDDALDPFTIWRSVGLMIRSVFSRASGPGSLHGFRVRLRRKAIKSADLYSYFVPGLNPRVDLFLELFSKEGSRRLNRLPNFGRDRLGLDRWHQQVLDSFEKSFADDSKSHSLRLLVPVRFFEDPPPNKSHERKGVFDIIRGIGIFYASHKDLDLQVSIFAKGPPEDLAFAHELVKASNLENLVIWLSVVPAVRLPEIFLRHDIVFDQVGDHWPGSNAYTALKLGLPVICNSRRLEYQPFFGEYIPFVDAKSPNEVAQALQYLMSPSARREVSQEGVNFVRRHALNKTFAEQLVDLLPSEIRGED